MVIVGIYKITSPSNKIYIGKSRDILRRFKDYKWGRFSGQRILKYSLLKYGWDKHTFEIIYELPVDVEDKILNRYEMTFIECYRCNKSLYPKGNGMNMTNGGDGVIGYVFTDEARERVKIGMKGKRRPQLKGKDHPYFGKRGAEHVAYGFRHTEESKKRISEAQKGDKHNMARRVINVKTGEIFGCIKDAAESVRMKRRTFNAQLNGQNTNNTGFIYYINN